MAVATVTEPGSPEPPHTPTTTPTSSTPPTAPLPTGTRTPAAAATPAGPTNNIALLSGTIVPTPTVLPRITPSPTTQPPLSWTLQGEMLPPAGAPITPANLAGLTLLARWGRGVINDVAYSPDGSLLAVATTSGIYLHDAHDLAAPPRWLRTGLAVDQVVFSPDGTELATILHRDSIQIWSLAEAKVTTTLPGQTKAIEFSADGQFLFSYVFQELSVWSLQENRKLTTIQKLSAFAVSPVEPVYAVVNRANAQTTVSLFETPGRKLLRTIDLGWDGGTYDEDVDYLAFSPDGTLLLVGRTAPLHSIGGQVEVVRVADGALLYTIDPVWPEAPAPPLCDSDMVNIEPIPFPIITNITFAPDGQTAAIRYDDAFVGRTVTHLHRVADGALIQAFPEETMGLAFNPTGSVLSFTDTGKLQQWAGQPFSLNKTVGGYNPAYRGLKMFPDGAILAAEAGRVVQLFSTLDGSVVGEYPDANQITIAADGSRFALAHRDGHVEMREQASGALLYQLSATGATVSTMALSPDGRYFVLNRADCQHLILEAATGMVLAELEAVSFDFEAEYGASRLQIDSLIFSPDSQRVAGTMSWRGHMAIWTVPDGAIEYLFSPEENAGVNLIVNVPSADSFVGLGSLRYYRDLSVWDFVSGSQLSMFDVPDSPSYHVGLAVTNQSQLIAVSTNMGQIDFWHESASAPLFNLMIPDYAFRPFAAPYVCAMTFRPDDQYMFGATSEGMVLVWGVP
ncbi:MAG: WD40 repeat domain-containing protein [Ardenticatenales bacterium]|nr:WD40 repeat domain-containing protein [Ardenticatenales bacterium]